MASVHPYVEAYKDADFGLFLAAEEHEVTRLLEMRDAAAVSLSSQLSPPREDVVAKLRSADEYVREEALVLALVHGWRDEPTLVAVLDQYDRSRLFFTRYYSARMFHSLRADAVRVLSHRLADVMLNERDERIRFGWLPVVRSLDSADAGRVCRGYMVSGTPVTQRDTYAISASMGPDFLASLRRGLARDGALDALRAIELLESVYLPEMQKRGKESMGGAKQRPDGE